MARLFARARKIESQDLRVELEGDLDTDGFLKGKDDIELDKAQIDIAHEGVARGQIVTDHRVFRLEFLRFLEVVECEVVLLFCTMLASARLE